MVRRRSLLLPVVLIAAGILFLLGNLGYVPWDRLYRLLDLWPLILIVVGLELIIRRGLPAPAVTPVAMVVIALGAAVAIVYVVAAPPLPSTTISSYQSSAPLGAATAGTLEIDAAAMEMTVRSADLGSDLYRASFEFPAGERPNVSVNGGDVHVSAPSQSVPRFFGRTGPRHLDLTLANGIPWRIAVNGGAASGTLDLGGLKLAGLDVSGGASRLDVTLPRPQGTVTITGSGGAERLSLHRPSGVEASVRLSGGANTLVADGERRSALGSDVSWTSGGYSSATDRYSISVSGGATSVTIDASG